jgi:hypothetical protein
MTPFEQVQQAYLHLWWAIKLNLYLRENPPAKKTDFDNCRLISDSAGTFCLPVGQFNTIADVLLGAENSVLLSVGALFLSLDTALDDAGIKNDPTAQDAFGQLRILIYMCRCAFAHNVLSPHWEIRGNYCRHLEITLPKISLTLNLNQLAGKQFDIKQIGDYSQLFKFADYVIQALTPNRSIAAPFVWLNLS